MKKFKKLVKAAQFEITGGSEYLWNCYGKNARYLDMTNENFNVELNLVFNSKNREVYQASLYLSGLAFRWIHPEFLNAYKEECYSRDIDPRIAYEEIFYTDCDVFEDFVAKVKDSFTTGKCDTSVLMTIDLLPEIEEIFSKLPEGSNIDEFVLNILETRMKELHKEYENTWNKMFSSLATEGINVTLNIPNSPVSETNVKDIYDWIVSLEEKEVALFYSDKDKAEGIFSKLTFKKEKGYSPSFEYQYKYQE